LLRIEKERKKYIPYFEDHRKVFQNIAVDAARKALVKKAKKSKYCDRPLQKQEVISQLSQIRKEPFKNEQKLKTYKIDMVYQYTSHKFNAAGTDWRISGDVSMNNLDLALKDLIKQMTHGMLENVRIQLSIRFPHNDKQPHRELLVKQDTIGTLYDWILFTVEYREVQISDATITLLKIYVPEGSGGSGRSYNNKIANKTETRSIVQILNHDTLCCV